MALARDSRNEAKLKAIRRAEFALKQRLERIDWEYDELQPEILEFQGKAQLPELPEESIIRVEYVDDKSPREDPKPRATRPRK